MAAFDGPFIFRINDAGNPGPNLLVQVCLERGWREYTEGTALRDHWNLWWRTGGHSNSLYKQLRAWQFTNHIPKGSSICRKDKLARALGSMRKVYGPIYDISPHCYSLPQEYTKLISEYSRQAADSADRPSTVWICKPVGQSQGKGIFLFRNISDLSYSSSSVVQRYVQDPLLIAGYKFDLRLYVCVPSFHPLRVYLYREGLARFSTERFSLNNLDNPYCHLTNTSLNKQGPGYAEMKERVGAAGCKWTLQQLRRHFQQARLPDWLLWQRISQLVVLTVLSQLRGVPRTANCFEFYGFDVLIDSSMKPWLLEVNLSPALGVDCDADPVVKKPMLHDLFDLLGMPVCNTGLSLFRIWSKNTPPALSTQLKQRHEEQIKHQQQQNQNHEQNQPRPSSQGSSSTEGLEGEDDVMNHKSPRRTNTSVVTAVTAASVWRRRSQTGAARARQTPAASRVDTRFRGTPAPSVCSSSSSNSSISDRARSARSLSVEYDEDGRRIDTDERVSLREQRGRGRSLLTRALARMDVLVTPKLELNESGELRVSSARLGDRSALKIPARSRKVRRCSAPEDQECESAVQLINNGSSVANKGRHITTTTSTRRSRGDVWGNGRDWSRPPAVEGDWVRVYPTCDSWMAVEEDSGPRARYFHDDEEAAELVPVGDREVKTIVASVQKLSRTIRDAHKKNTKMSDDEHHRLVCTALDEDVVLWLPRI